VLVCPRDGWGNSAWHMELTCLVCQMSHRQVWSQWRWWRWLLQWQPTSFLSVTWRGEAYHRLGLQGV
jgi:hypothetical protein